MGVETENIIVIFLLRNYIIIKNCIGVIWWKYAIKCVELGPSGKGLIPNFPWKYAHEIIFFYVYHGDRMIKGEGLFHI
jgi:hypothetical protein